jgi:ADP-ribosylglycohydrolase
MRPNDEWESLLRRIYYLYLSMYHDSRLRLLFLGLAAGDSLGSTSEFVRQEDMPELYNSVKASGWPFRQIGGGSHGWAPGDPTDDTQMALCILRLFMEGRSFDPSRIAKEFINWANSRPMDIGISTSETLRICQNSANYWDGGYAYWVKNPKHAANGSLMRNGVIAGMADSLENAFEMTLKHGMITHYAPLPQICCLAQTYLLWELLSGKSFTDTWTAGFQKSLEGYLGTIRDAELISWFNEVSEDDHFAHAMDDFTSAQWNMGEFNPFNTYIRGNGGYCLLTLQIAVWCLHWSLRKDAPDVPESFPGEVLAAEGPSRLAWAAMVGHDADTYAATAGPLIAAAHSGLPSNITDGLKAMKIFENP